MTALHCVLILGQGAFGRAIAERATARGIADVRMATRAENLDNAALSNDRLAGVDVVIDATHAAAVLAHVEATMRARVPMVVGTTGWAESLPAVEQVVARHRGALLHAANFATGVMRLTALVREVGRWFPASAGYATTIVETHHAAKRDAPSGTARQLAAALPESVPIASIRVGHVPGTHEVLVDGPFEQLRLVHEVRDRRLFADGAIDAATWLCAEPRQGVYTMHDVLSGVGAA
jgi:4-hydroxy-tetrahydrodipicolinate reductase